MKKMYAVVLYDSEINKIAHTYARLVESEQSEDCPSTACLLTSIEKCVPMKKASWDELFCYRVSDKKASELLKASRLKMWPVCNFLKGESLTEGCFEVGDGNFFFVKKISKKELQQQRLANQLILDAMQEMKAIKEHQSYLAAFSQLVGKVPLLSHVNAGCSLAASIALLAVGSYLIEQAATVGSLGFEVGAGFACAAFVGCVVWAVFALMSYAHVNKTGDKTDDIKHMLITNFSRYRRYLCFRQSRQNKSQESVVVSTSA